VRPQDVVTPDDARGMRSLLALLGGDPAREAAQALLRSARRVLLCTGFPVDAHPETDGPPGAVALALALRAIGRPVTFASWDEILCACAPWLPDVDLLAVPRGPSHGEAPAGDVVAMEACGRTRDGSYRRMTGEDVRAAAPHFESWVGERVLVSIGDGGNEMGMGSAPPEWFSGRDVVAPISTCEVLVPASVSNWGCLAVVAELSLATGRRLLPRTDRHLALIEDLVAHGFVDGFTATRAPLVDGRPLSATAAILDALERCTHLPSLF
jgi:hypothetical protein